MNSRPDIHIQASSFTLHCDIFHFDSISSLFSDITHHHLWYSFFVFSFIIAHSTLSLFHLEWWFLTHHCMEDCHVLSLIRLRAVVQKSYFERLSCQWEFMLHQYMGSVYSFSYVFHGRSFTIDRSMLKKKKKRYNAFFIISFSIGHVYGHTSLFHWVHVLERVHMRASFWDSILVYFEWEYESPIRFLWESRATFL